ncbi:MAG: hypothetical protein ACRDRK_13255 [Pseudonocardia sp.]
MTGPDVREVMARYDAGQIDAHQAAAMVQPAYDDAAGERARRTAESNERDPDDASTPTAFVEVDVARQTDVITMEQYDALADALVGH